MVRRTIYIFNKINSLINDSTNFNSSLKSEWNKIDSIDIHNYEKISLFDLEHYLTDNLLYKVDIASMASSLEVRVPFLDHEFVEYAINLDVRQKINNKEQKYILKKNLEKYLSNRLTYRKKWGFPSPTESWLYGDLKKLVDKYLSKNIIIEQGIFNYNFINHILLNL